MFEGDKCLPVSPLPWVELGLAGPTLRGGGVALVRRAGAEIFPYYYYSAPL